MTPRRLLPLLALALLPVGAARGFDVVLNAQGEFLDAYLVNGQPFPPKKVFIDPDPADPASLGTPPRVGRHVNGRVCFFPHGIRHNGQFVIADDTYREACVDENPPQARCRVRQRRSPFFVGKDVDGWGVFRSDGTWTRQHLHVARKFVEPLPQGAIDPQGCLFDDRGRLWTNDVGHGSFTATDGSLIVFFPGPNHRYSKFCFVDKALSTPGMPVMDEAGNVYVPEPARGKITKFAPPFPASPRDCRNDAHLVTTPPTKTVFLSGHGIPLSMLRVPGSDHWYVASVIGPPAIDEFDASGNFVRNIVPPNVPKNPIGMDVGAAGTLYYAEVNLDPATLVDTRCGSVSMVRFDASGQPMAPELLGRHLSFPDGVTVVDSSQLGIDPRTLPAAVEPDASTCGGE